MFSYLASTGPQNQTLKLALFSKFWFVMIQTGSETSLAGNEISHTGNKSSLTRNESSLRGNDSTSGGNVSFLIGNVSSPAGNVLSPTGNVSSPAGNVSSQTGNVSFLTGNEKKQHCTPLLPDFKYSISNNYDQLTIIFLISKKQKTWKKK
jgi:hypothetical protein